MGDVGILTFHCADNYGAMLQAYGLKRYLRKKQIAAQIVPYEPPFMTGRHWWIPYVPLDGGIRVILRHAWWGWWGNLKRGRAFFRRRANMRRFRETYLTGKRRKKLLFSGQLKRLPYRYYIVGSDQIWNPGITLGLKKVYFGAFKNRNKKKVIAYAASLGGTSLAPVYDTEFTELLKSVDCVSLRERAAVPYVREHYEGEVLAVPDPVFLLREGEWEHVEKAPDMEGYIFVYMIEKNDRMADYVKELAERKRLPVIQIKYGAEIVGNNVRMDRTAGPAEFLGYLHKADYVVTNSFHGAAFSIIFQKKFVVFPHSSTGARMTNILELCGLESRMYREDRDLQIEEPVAWDGVKRRVKEHVNLAEDFLMKSLRQQD